MDSENLDEENDLVRRCLADDAAAQKSFHEAYSSQLNDHLSSVGAMRVDAEEIAANFVHECLYGYKGSVPRLSKKNPKAPLLAWLRLGSTRYFRDCMRKRKREQLTGETEPQLGRPEETGEGGHAPIDDDLELLTEALRYARRTVPAEDYVLCALACHRVRQGFVAAMLGYSGSKVSRKIKDCLQKLKTETLSYIESVDPHYQFAWEDLAKIANDFLNEPSDEEPEDDEDSSYGLDIENKA